MASPAVPDIVIGRLPLYLRALTRMAAGGRLVTSSQELGETSESRPPRSARTSRSSGNSASKVRATTSRS